MKACSLLILVAMGFVCSALEKANAKPVVFKNIILSPDQLLRLTHPERLTYFRALHEYLEKTDRFAARLAKSQATKESAYFQNGFFLFESAYAAPVQSPSGIGVGKPCIIGGWSSQWQADNTGHLWCGPSPAQRRSIGQAERLNYQCREDGSGTKCSALPYLYDSAGRENCVDTKPTLSQSCGQIFSANYDNNATRLEADLRNLAGQPTTKQQWTEFIAGLQSEYDATLSFRDSSPGAQHQTQQIAADEKLNALKKLMITSANLRDKAGDDEPKPVPSVMPSGPSSQCMPFVDYNDNPQQNARNRVRSLESIPTIEGCAYELREALGHGHLRTEDSDMCDVSFYDKGESREGGNFNTDQSVLIRTGLCPGDQYLWIHARPNGRSGCYFVVAGAQESGGIQSLTIAKMKASCRPCANDANCPRFQRKVIRNPSAPPATKDPWGNSGPSGGAQ